MKPEKYPEIRDLALFANISANSFATLTRGAYIQNYPPMTELIIEGDSADFLHIILAGSIEMFAGWKDRETTLSTQGPISTFLLAATIKDRPNLLSARTLEKSRIMLIPSEDVRAVFDQDPEFSKSIVDDLAGSYRDSIRHSKNLKLRTSRERLANYLIRLHYACDRASSMQLPYEKRRLASYLGMTPENLSRSFNALKEYGVRVQNQTVHLDDPDGLWEYSGSDALIDGHWVTESHQHEARFRT